MVFDRKEYSKNYYKNLTKEQRNKRNAYSRGWRLKNPEKYKASKLKWRKNMGETKWKALCKKHNKKWSNYNKQKLLEDKKNCFEAYGGCVCKLCNFKDIRALTLDHVNNDGAKERKTKRLTGNHIYSYLRREGYPDKHRYQVLCFNCNTIKEAIRRENGR